MHQGNAALQWVLDTDDDCLSEFFDDDVVIDDLTDFSLDQEDSILPEWVRNEFEYDMRAFN